MKCFVNQPEHFRSHTKSRSMRDLFNDFSGSELVQLNPTLRRTLLKYLAVLQRYQAPVLQQRYESE